MTIEWGLEESEPARELYLAVPLDAYNTFFKKRFAQTVIQRFDIKLVIFDVEKEEIVRWTK